MSTSLAVREEHHAAILEQVLIKGDLGKLSPDERVSYYRAVCESVGLNPLTKPFEYIVLNNRLTLYALKAATDQLRKRDNVSLSAPTFEVIEGVLVVTITASDGDGRTDTDIGAVAIADKRGDALANGYKRAITQAKRRVTLAICGLGMLDESEIEDVPAERRRAVTVDSRTGEILDAPAPVRQTSASPANFSGFCDDRVAARIRELAPAKGIDLSGLATQPIPWRVVVNAIRERGGVVTVGPHGEIDVTAVGAALKALPDVPQSWDEVQGDEDGAAGADEPDANFDEDGFAAAVDRQVAERRQARLA